MADVMQLPQWLGAALIGAIIASLGYVSKAVIELLSAARQRRNSRRAALIELYSLLRAAGVTFRIQNQQARKLAEMAARNHPDAIRGAIGLEETNSKAFAHFGASEKELHSLIRSMTVKVLQPTNAAILEWLRKDSYHKAQPIGRANGLSGYLAQLEAHMILWQAKYEAWIPDNPEHALVYLDDEKAHGLGFPVGIDEVIARVTGLPDPRVTMPAAGG